MLNNKDRIKLKKIQERIGGKDILLKITLMDYTDSPELARNIKKELKAMIVEG